MRELIFSASKKDFRVDTFRAGGKGGQHQNKTESGVRITHISSGLSAESRTSRSQHQNKKLAFRKLADKIVADVKRNQKKDISVSNEVVRTYNVVDNRIKDHRSGVQMPFDSLENDLDVLIDARRKAIVNGT